MSLVFFIITSYVMNCKQLCAGAIYIQQTKKKPPLLQEEEVYHAYEALNSTGS